MMQRSSSSGVLVETKEDIERDDSEEYPQPPSYNPPPVGSVAHLPPYSGSSPPTPDKSSMSVGKDTKIWLSTLKGKKRVELRQHHILWPKKKEPELAWICFFIDSLLFFNIGNSQGDSRGPDEMVIITTLSMKNIVPPKKPLDKHPFSLVVPVKGKNCHVIFEDEDKRNDWLNCFRAMLLKSNTFKKLIPFNFEAGLKKLMQIIPRDHPFFEQTKITPDKEKKWWKTIYNFHQKRTEHYRSLEAAYNLLRYRASEEYSTYIKWFIKPRDESKPATASTKSFAEQLAFVEESVFKNWEIQLSDFEEIKKACESTNEPQKKGQHSIALENIDRLNLMIQFLMDIHKAKSTQLENYRNSWQEYSGQLTEKKGKAQKSHRKGDSYSKKGATTGASPAAGSGAGAAPGTGTGPATGNDENERKKGINRKASLDKKPALTFNLNKNTELRKAQSAKPDSASAPPKPEQKSEDMSAPQLSLTKELLTDTRSFFGNSKIEILMVRANELAFQGRYADAVLLFQTINELSPQNLEILVRLGTACAMIGNMELAQNYLNQAFQINPKDPRVINNLALTFIPTGNFDQVNHFMEVLLETNENQNYYYGLNNLAAIHFLQQKYKEAEILFDRAMLLNPKHHVVLNNKAVLLGALGMYRESLPYFDNAIAIDPSYLKAQVNKRVVLEFIKPDLKTLETPAPFEQEGDHWFTGALQNITEPETLPKETQKEAPTTISITESHGAHLALNSSQTEDNNFDPWGSPLPAATRPPSQQVASTPRTIFSNYFNQSHPTSHPEAQDNPWGPQAAPSTHHPPLPHIMEQKVDEETESNPWGVSVPSLPQAAPSTHHLPLPQIVEHKVAEEIQLNPWGVDVSSLPASSQVPLNPWGEPSPFQSQSTSTPWSEPSSGASSSLASTSVASDRPIKASSSMTASNPWSVSLEHANSMSNISGGGGDTKANAIQFKSPAQERAVDVASPRTIVPGEIGRLDLEEVDKHYNRSDGSTEEKVSDGNSDVKEMDYMPSPRSRATSMTSPHLNEEERKKRKTKLKDSSQDITQTPKDSTIIFKQKLTLPKNISRADIFGRKKSPREDTPKSAKSPRSDSPNLEKSKDKE